MRVDHPEIGQVERVIALRTFSAFHDLSPAELAVMAEHARPRRFEPGAPLMRHDMPGRSLFFIVSGRVEVRRDGRVLRTIEAQDVVGGLAALTQSADEDAVAIEPTLALQLDREDMEDVFEDNFPIFLAMLEVMSRTLIGVRKRLGPRAGYTEPEARASEPVTELDLVERILVLRQTMNFAQTQVEALADIAQEAVVVRLEPRQELWSPGDSARFALVLVSGVVRCATDREQRFGFGPGALVGGLDSFAGQPRWYRAWVESAGLALRIEAQSLLDVIEDNMDLATDMLRVLARELRELDAAGRLRDTALPVT